MPIRTNRRRPGSREAAAAAVFAADILMASRTPRDWREPEALFH